MIVIRCQKDKEDFDAGSVFIKKSIQKNDITSKNNWR